MIKTVDRFGWLSVWQEIAGTVPDSRLYAFVDMAAPPAVMAHLKRDGTTSLCLFGYSLDTPIAQGTPRLILLDDSPESPILQSLLQGMPETAIATLISSTIPIAELAEHLHNARRYELSTMRDLVNYVSIAFAYGAGFDQQDKFLPLLLEVKDKRMTFDHALKKLVAQELPP